MAYDKDKERKPGRYIEPEEVHMLQRIDLFMTVISLSEEQFIQGQIFNFKKFGDRMYVTEPQMAWLRKLDTRLYMSLTGMAGIPAKGSLESERKYVKDDVEF